MAQFLSRVRWMDGVIWALVMFTGFGLWETQVQGVPATPGWLVSRIAIWGVTGMGYAIISTWFAAWRERSAANAPAKPQGGYVDSAQKKQTEARQVRRAAEREARKSGRRDG
jgi:hypothetical protein